MRTSVQYAAIILAALAAVACEPEGVGDPCDPEQIPAGGFNGAEAYLETSSVQCRTRVCMVYRLNGNPTQLTGTDSCVDPDQCVTQEQVDKSVYCTCRCGAPAGSTTDTCECPDGYTCAPVLELGGSGVRGSYCVKNNDLLQSS